MKTELEKLRISKGHKAVRHERAVWPWMLLLLLLAAGGGAAYYYWDHKHSPTPVETLRIRMPAGSVNEDDLVALQATGYIMAAHRIELASKVIGRVAWIGVEMGDKIKQDQVLVRLEDDEYRARFTQQQGLVDNAKARLAELKAGSRPEEIAQAKAQWDRAVIDYETADRAWKRLLALKDLNSVTQNEMDDAESLAKSRKVQAESQRQQYELMKAGARTEQIDAQEATVRELEGSLQMARLDLDNTVIRAPVSSTILERNVEVGEFVTNGFVGDRGAKGYVVSIADLNDLLVDMDISQNDFAKVSAAQPCWITTDAYPDRRYEGQVERISPMANRSKATVQVRVQVTSPDEFLKPDMNATVSFLRRRPESQPATAAAAEKPALRIPASAVRDGAVFLVVEGKVARRSVTVSAPNSSGDVEVRKGLSGGEELILHPADTLKEGDSVKINYGQN